MPARRQGMIVRDALKSYLALATGVTDLTRQTALAAARALVSQGEATAEQVTGLAEDLLAQTRQNREAVVALVSHEVDRALARVGLASADEVVALVQRVRELEGQLQSTAATVGASIAQQAASTGRSGRQAPTEPAGPQAAGAQAAPARRKAAKQAATAKAVQRRQPASGRERPSPADAAEVPAAPTQDDVLESTAPAPAPLNPRRKAPAVKRAPAKRAPAERKVPAKGAPAERKVPAKKAPAEKTATTKAAAAGPAPAAPAPEPGESPA